MSAPRPVLTPDCPLCGWPPEMRWPVLIPLCFQEHCRVIQWNPYLTKAQNLADVQELDLPDWLAGGNAPD